MEGKGRKETRNLKTIVTLSSLRFKKLSSSVSKVSAEVHRLILWLSLESAGLPYGYSFSSLRHCSLGLRGALCNWSRKLQSLEMGNVGTARTFWMPDPSLLPDQQILKALISGPPLFLDSFACPLPFALTSVYSHSIVAGGFELIS